MKHINPLDPFAYAKEEFPFEASIMYGGATVSSQSGIHTTPDIDRAMLYAVHRAGLAHTPLSAEDIEEHGSNAGVILVLDVEDLEPLPDIDAEVTSKRLSHVVEEFLDRDDVQEALEEEDVDTLINILETEVELEKQEDELWTDMEKWDQVVSYVLQIGEPWEIFQALANLGKEDPGEFLEALEYAQQHKGKLSYSTWADAIKQRRYMESIDIDRLVKIIAIRPVRLDVFGAYRYKDEDEDGYPEENLELPQVFSRPMIYNKVYKPHMVILWENEDYEDYPPEEIDYHGTDLTRARQAFPSIAQHLVSPWNYTQE
jgi:hypothetical protein